MFRLTNISNKTIFFQKVPIQKGMSVDFMTIYDFTQLTQLVNARKIMYFEVKNDLTNVVTTSKEDTEDAKVEIIPETKEIVEEPKIVAEITENADDEQLPNFIIDIKDTSDDVKNDGDIAENFDTSKKSRRKRR